MRNFSWGRMKVQHSTLYEASRILLSHGYSFPNVCIISQSSLSLPSHEQSIKVFYHTSFTPGSN